MGTTVHLRRLVLHTDGTSRGLHDTGESACDDRFEEDVVVETLKGIPLNDQRCVPCVMSLIGDNRPLVSLLLAGHTYAQAKEFLRARQDLHLWVAVKGIHAALGLACGRKGRGTFDPSEVSCPDCNLLVGLVLAAPSN
jgi:hypothetical protein